MSKNRAQNWKTHHVGHLLLTVELDPPADCCHVEQHRGLAGLTRQLVDLLEVHRLPATWAACDPVHSAATPSVLVSALEHEMAILGDSNWLGPTAGRTRFARELSRRITQARAAGIEIVSLAPRLPGVQPHIDLLVKQGVTAITGIYEEGDRQVRFPAPKALHYGVWELPTTARLPVQETWLGGSKAIMRQIRRAAQDGATFHLAFDAPAMEQKNPGSLKTVEPLLREVALLRDRGLLRVETLATASARLSNIPARSPQRSILRLAG